MSTLKGCMVTDAFEFSTQKFGPESVNKVMGNLSPEDQAKLSGKILPITKVDFNAFMHFLIAEDKLFGKGDMSLVKENAVYTSRKSLSKFYYKTLLNLISPSLMLKGAPQFNKQTYGDGDMEVSEKGNHNIIIKLVNASATIPLHHEVYVGAGIAETMSLTGAKNIRMTHPKCVARGDEYCIFDIAWD